VGRSRRLAAARALAWHTWDRRPHARPKRHVYTWMSIVSAQPDELRYPRQYVAFLYTDLWQSTALAKRAGHERATALMDWHNATLLETFKRYGGREGVWRGDGYQAQFRTAHAALLCAAACQRALAAHNAAAPEAERLYARMGVSCGEVTVVQRRPGYGLVQIVARSVMEAAQPQQILVSGHVLPLLLGTDWVFKSIGVRRLTSLEYPVELYAFHWWNDLAQGQVDTPPSREPPI
jgi:class 3 adenylate cyclase